jgi:hypothetical protein
MKIPYGYCHCGCGQKTNISKQNHKKNGWIKGEPQKYIYGHKKKNKNGTNQRIDSIGYITVICDNHPKSHKRRIREHILIAEKALGKYLPNKSEVHHYGEKTDNSKLVICEDKAYHMLLHRRKRAYDACGNANFIKCVYCKQWDDPQNMTIVSGRDYCAYHKSCIKHGYM